MWKIFYIKQFYFYNIFPELFIIANNILFLGSFHLLHLMYEEYLMYVLDVNKIQQHEKAMWKELHGADAKGKAKKKNALVPICPVLPYFQVPSTCCILCVRNT